MATKCGGRINQTVLHHNVDDVCMEASASVVGTIHSGQRRLLRSEADPYRL
jgi:hypothetical protein